MGFRLSAAVLAAAVLASPMWAAPPAVVATVPTVAALFSAERTAVLKPAVDARVIAVTVAEGAAVRAGTVLIRLDDREQRARVSLAAQAAGSGAETRSANVRAREAAARMANVAGAAAKGAATEWEVRQARAAMEASAAEERMAHDRQTVEGRRLGLERVVLDSFVIRAPFAGRVTRLNTRDGSTVRKTDSVATVVDLSTLRAEAFVPVRAYAALKVGRGYAVQFAAPFAARRRAVLAFIDPVIDAGLVRAVFKVDNSDGALPSGLEARIALAPLP
jgi:RND family efflux transporter MFP subunit